jgi:hypothetical protein
VKQVVVTNDVGEVRHFEKEPAKLEFSNLQISLAEAGAQTWTDWFDDFVVKGNADSTKERKGRLAFLSPNLKTTLAEIAFFNLGIFRLAREPQSAGAETVSRLRADLYCERMEFSTPKS